MEKKKALVIDDDQIVLESVRKVLSAESYDVDVKSKGIEGRDSAIEGQYDIVLTDIRMPDMGGMRILRDVKRAKPSVPVLMITGYATVKSAVQAMKLGASDYLEKPFTPDELLKAVASALHIAATREPEEQGIVHKEEILKILERAARDTELVYNLLYHGSEALEEYNLTGPEKLAVLTGDIHWIEKHVGPLTPVQKKWLEQRVSAEIW
jgi:DNA-binding NtrC family response regulator